MKNPINTENDEEKTLIPYQQSPPLQPTSEQFYPQELKNFHELYWQMDQHGQKLEIP